jgi:uncharacterized protein YukE
MAISKLEYSTARNCVSEFGTISTEMRSTFSDLKREMESLEDDLKSKGGDALYAKYKALEPKLAEVPDKVDDFKTFLEGATQEYEKEDLTLQKQAGD